MELSILCDCNIALVVFGPKGKMFTYGSQDMSKMLLEYTQSDEPRDHLTNTDVSQIFPTPQNKPKQKSPTRSAFLFFLCSSPSPQYKHSDSDHNDNGSENLYGLDGSVATSPDIDGQVPDSGSVRKKLHALCLFPPFFLTRSFSLPGCIL